MNLTAEIIVKQDVDDIKRLFEAEEKAFKNERANYELICKDDYLLIKINAKDGSALRAVLNSITKTLTIYEKTKKLIDEDE